MNAHPSSLSDRELLELAAKAAGKPIRWDGNVCVLTAPDYSSDECSAWNPLANDGDALRLAVKLLLEIHIERDFIRVWTQTGDCLDVGLDEGVDSSFATRRAIVIAAASLAK